MRSWLLIAISVGLLVGGLLLSLYSGIFLLFIFLPIGLLWSAFRGKKGTPRPAMSGGQAVCSNCGTLLNENTRFCPTCGQQVG
ncbi:MAG: zinc-ribbon domain-containing protein [Nitrososphaerales archaeon]